jgi:peptidoglycan/LPS O-acetylase OafA/YrhL
MKIVNILALCVCIVFFTVINHLISVNLSSISAVTISAWSDHEDTIKLYFDDSLDFARFHESKTSTSVLMPEKENVGFTLFMQNRATNFLRIDPGDHAGIFRLYYIVIHPKSKIEKRFDAAELYNMLEPATEGIKITLEDLYVEISSTEDNPYLFLRSDSIERKRIGIFSIPVFILAFFLYVFLSRHSWKQFRNYFLIQRERPRAGEVLQPLDGLRGIAAIWVVAEHSWFKFVGAGFSGVLIFFVLSGFLLAKPFVGNSAKLFQPGFMVKYGKRRIQRILPMYYLYIFLVYWMPLSVDEALLHTFFIKANGHLWTIPQEMTFYLVFPLIVIFNCYVLRDKIWLIIPGLMASIYAWNTFVKLKVVYLCGAINQPLQFYLSIFLTGVLFSYFYYGYFQKKQKVLSSTIVRYSAAVTGLIILVGFTVLSNGYTLNISTVPYSKNYPETAAIIVGILLFVVLCSPKTFLTKFLSNSLLCSLGTVSYSLYLLHPLVIGLIVKISSSYFNLNMKGAMLFLLALPLSYFVSCFTYRRIERPFLVSK